MVNVVITYWHSGVENLISLCGQKGDTTQLVNGDNLLCLSKLTLPVIGSLLLRILPELSISLFKLIVFYPLVCGDTFPLYGKAKI